MAFTSTVLYRARARSHLMMCLLTTAVLGIGSTAVDAQSTNPGKEQVQHNTTHPSLELPAFGSETAEVLHAGGAVQLQIPADWVVREVPQGREVRLLLCPPSPHDANGDVLEADTLLWLVLRYRPEGLPSLTDDQLVKTAATKLDYRLGGAKVRPAQSPIWMNGAARWAKLEFELPTGRQTLREGATRGEPPQTVVGTYLLQQVDWGRLEVCSLQWDRDAQESRARSADLQPILSSIRLIRPQPKPQRSRETVGDALHAMGLWKASRSMMRLEPNGRIAIISDEPFEVEEIEDAGAQALGDTQRGDDRAQVPQTAAQVIGEYTAQGDVIYTVWEDGSKLNYRWKIHHGDLLLTDHRGRTAKLWRLSE